MPTKNDGFVDIPNGPGLGMNVLENAEEIRPKVVNPIKMRPHKDGFVVDQ